MVHGFKLKLYKIHVLKPLVQKYFKFESINNKEVDHFIPNLYNITIRYLRRFIRSANNNNIIYNIIYYVTLCAYNSQSIPSENSLT